MKFLFKYNCKSRNDRIYFKTLDFFLVIFYFILFNINLKKIMVKTAKTSEL